MYEFYIKKSEDYANLGQFENASLCCEKASDLVNLYKKRFDFDLSNLLFQKGSLIVQQDQNISEAIPHFKQCICLTNKSRNLKFHLSSIYLAKCYLNLKQYENSIDVLNNELQILESTIPDNLDMPEYLINWFKEETILNLAKAHELKNDFNETEILIEDGLKLATNKLKYSDNFLHKFLNNKGSLLIETGNYKKALEIYEKVIQDCSQEFLLAAPSSKLQAYSNDDLLKATEGKAWSLYMLAKLSNEKKDIIENLKNCLSTYEFLIELTDKHRKLSLSENDNLFLGETYDSIFDNTIKTANLLYHATHENEYLLKAFAYADSKKAHVISCNMNDTRDKRAGKIPDSLLAKEKNLKEAISFIQSREREGRFSEKEQASGTDKLLVLTNELEKLISKFENEYPEYYWLKYKTRTVDIPALFKQVGNEKTLVEFSLTSDSLFTFIVSAGKIHLVNRPSIGIEDSVLHFRKKLSYMNDHALTRQGIDEYVHEASWLYKILIKPAEPYILGKEITIVPDGPLSLLPFDALVSSDSLPKQPDYGLLPYLLYKYTIGYAYSAELYSMQQQMNPAAVDGVLAFAPEYKNFLYNRPGNLSNKPATIMLSPLRGSQEEAENITGTFGGKAITGKKATETMFKRHAAENKVLHLAMHTIVDNEFPMYSKLVFSTTKDTTDDGFLNTFEVYNLDLKTPLVVLSACNTGYGKLMKGEGIISLARGFIYAGCPSMVITLWSIADRSSSDLMQLFYKNLDKKQNIDRSLQNAKIEYIQSSDQRMSHPYYWAGFIQTGKTSPVIKTKTPKWYAWPVGLGIVIICFGLLFYYRKY